MYRFLINSQDSLTLNHILDLRWENFSEIKKIHIWGKLKPEAIIVSFNDLIVEERGETIICQRRWQWELNKGEITCKFEVKSFKKLHVNDDISIDQINTLKIILLSKMMIYRK